MKRWKLERAKGKLQDCPEKRDETRAISTLAGMLLGSALGVPTSIALGLLGPPGRSLPSYDFSGNLTFFSSLFSFSIFFGCPIAFATCSYLWKKEGKANLAQCALSSFTLGGLWMYILVIFVLLFVPLNNFLLQYLTPVSVFWYVALAFFPFIVLITYVLFPSLRLRIRQHPHLLVTREFWSEIGRNPKKHRRMLFLTTALVIVIVVDVLSILY